MYFTTASAGFAGALGQLWARRLRCDRSLDELWARRKAGTLRSSIRIATDHWHPSLANRGREGQSREILALRFFVEEIAVRQKVAIDVNSVLSELPAGLAK